MMQGSLAARLRILRAERGLTLRAAATLTGVTKETISDLERGRRHPHDPTLAKIARGYGVPFEELIEEPTLSSGRRLEASTTLAQLSEFASAHASIYWDLARDFQMRFPSGVKRIEVLDRAAGILKGYSQRWDTELQCHIEDYRFPYGKGIETDYLFQGIANSLREEGFEPYAVLITEERIEEATPGELAAARRFLEGLHSMANAVERVREAERQMRPDQGDVERELAELERWWQQWASSAGG